MFCEESLRKIKSGAFLKCIGPQILSLQGADYCGSSEHYRVVEKKIRILLSKTAMVGCCELSLYVNGSCDFSAMIEMMCHVDHFFDIWQ